MAMQVFMRQWCQLFRNTAGWSRAFCSDSVYWSVLLVKRCSKEMSVCTVCLLTESLTSRCPLLRSLCYPIFLFLLLLPHWPPKLLSSSHLFLSLLICCPPSGGCQGPAGGGATGSGTQPGPVRHHGPTEAGRDQGADPPWDPQGAEDQRRCREPAKGKVKVFLSKENFLVFRVSIYLYKVRLLRGWDIWTFSPSYGSVFKNVGFYISHSATNSIFCLSCSIPPVCSLQSWQKLDKTSPVFQ